MSACEHHARRQAAHTARGGQGHHNAEHRRHLQHATKSEQHAAIENDYSGRQVAVLVSDLAHFTSMTRQYGIVHVASVILRMRQVSLPVFHALGVLHIATEGDDMIAVFPDAVHTSPCSCCWSLSNPCC